LTLFDNPVWKALSTLHASFAEGTELAKRYPIDVAPFADTRDQFSESYQDSPSWLARQKRLHSRSLGRLTFQLPGPLFAWRCGTDGIERPRIRAGEEYH